MAYVPIPYPQVLYDSTGLPLTVKHAGAAALVPAMFGLTPTAPATLVAFPPALIAQAIKIPPAVALALPPTLSTLIALNTPMPTTRKSRGDF